MEEGAYQPQSDEFRGFVRELTKNARDDEREWKTIMTYFREGLIRDQRLLVELIWAHARYGPEPNCVEAFVRILNELGLRLSLAPPKPTCGD